ncbi:hypothetical protein F5876DRAFT_69797 [Lentinula aff. lateritia]|uniref:Uncharacterized protein n=1 Tax=Lentinula aff. lateritia TaxID=2804960 RepID=A0ACC1TL18_9AGAR|nr:hypothetical protein F5876DRAFT_69797 [Lentinula aff. lateritia]
MPLSSFCASFCVELVGECMSHMKDRELHACSLVCHSWRVLAQSLFFETIVLRRGVKKLARLERNPHLLRHVRHIIGETSFPFPEMFTAYGPLRIRTLEFRENVRYGPAPLANIVNAIRTVSLTLETFTLRDSIPVSYPAFCDILKALGRCKRLRNLTLPPPYRIGDNQSAAQQRADDALAEFDKMARDLLPFEDRPQLNFLQLIPSAYRDNPRPNTAAMRDPLASEYKWLEEGKCPFNLRLLRELVIGPPVAIQVVLPITRRSLHRLEVCQAFDTRSSWTLYGEFCAVSVLIV